jgi:hypothetical protein
MAFISEVVMAKQTALELKRKEVREEILAMKEKIPSVRILNFFGKTFKSQSLEYWLSNFIILNAMALSPWLLIGLALDELTSNKYLWIPGLLVVVEAIIGIFLTRIIVVSVFDDIADRIIIKINNVGDLIKQMQWLSESWSKRNVLRFILFWELVWLSLGVGGFSIAYHNFVGFGFSITGMIVGLLAGIGFYTTVWVGLLAYELRNYQYQLNAFSPVDSEIINDITELLTKPTYILAAYFAVVTLMAASNLTDQQIRILFSLPFLFIAWIIITAQFLLTRLTIGRIVSDAKWKTLNKIQAKINSIEATGDLSDKETAERLLRLVDIHTRVVASRSSTFDLKSLTTFISQLMLPLLGLLLGNFDKVLTLLP